MASSYLDDEPVAELETTEPELPVEPLRPFVMIEAADTTAVCGPDGECY
jgi:hypothetical protein